MPDADIGRNRRAPPPIEPRDNTLGKAVLVIGAIGALVYAAHTFSFRPTTPPAPAQSLGAPTTPLTPAEATAKAKITACQNDWHQCQDNSQMVNNWNGWYHVEAQCKDAANKMAKYGDPKWPWFAFSTFHTGTSYKSGQVTVIEPDAQFQNGFGAMTHVQVVCDYDLNRNAVLNVSLNQR